VCGASASRSLRSPSAPATAPRLLRTQTVRDGVAEGHHDDHFPHLWCAAPPGAQDELIQSEPERFFRPPYVGGRGWIGVRLDGDIDWAEVAAICEDAYRGVAPRKLVALLDSSST